MAVLFVEDDGSLAHVLHLFAESMGLEHDVACDGREALDRLRERPYELVVTDLNMPGMNGIMLREMIRQEWPRMPVFANTAGLGGYEREDLEVLFDRVYMKPGDISRMMAEIIAYSLHDAVAALA